MREIAGVTRVDAALIAPAEVPQMTVNGDERRSRSTSRAISASALSAPTWFAARAAAHQNDR